MAPDVPSAAVSAAMVELDRWQWPGKRGKQVRDLVTKMLAAAVPAIAAAERERIRSLLPYNRNCCEGFPAAVADLIGEHADG